MEAWLWAVLCGCLIQLSDGKPPAKPQQGPCIGMDCLHGVLMHNDEEQNGDHKAEDQYLRFKDKLETERAPDGPLNAADTYHAALMHDNDEEAAKRDADGEMLPELRAKIRPKDAATVMHDLLHEDGETRKHAWETNAEDEQPAAKKGPLDAEEMMHGVLMHGDASHGLHPEEEKKTGKVKAGPESAEDLMHGVLMHGDVEEAREHVRQQQVEEAAEPVKEMSGPDPDQLHGVLMHGDTETGHDHSEEHKRLSVEEVFSDIYKLLEMDLAEDLMRVINIKQILERQQAEYDEWLAINRKSEDHRETKGATLLSVPDSLYEDIQLMKTRYLDSQDSPPPSTEETTKSKKKEVRAKEVPFSAEDAVESLDKSSMDHEDEDTRHNLELIGSTEPINARHKAFVALKRSRASRSDDL